MKHADSIQRRAQHVGGSLSLAYREPLKIVRGRGAYLYDEDGNEYLDCVNNVCHVGHCHPRVVEAASRQMAELNTNTRYLHDHLLEYAERLSGTMPEHLEVCYFVCSGSEANELALRLARTSTGCHDVVVLNAAYHGNTSALIGSSPYKFDGPGGAGRPLDVHVAPAPDVFRGEHRARDERAAQRYAAAVGERIDAARASGRDVALFLAESALGCAGQIIPPAGYLASAFEEARQRGVVCVADEVQVGFGRVGTHFWAFEAQDACPDVVTLGKPIGNGHPLAAVVTTRAIAEAFDNGMEYFNTFGGNPVSCAIGLAVLDVIEEEELQANALRVGKRLLSEWRSITARHRLVGDVRGQGLFLGIELVRDPETLEPADTEATEIVERMKQRRILLSTDGPLHNVIKFKPPLVFSDADADRLCENLAEVLAGWSTDPG